MTAQSTFTEEPNMRRLCLALCSLALLPTFSQALELKNVRLTHGPLGAPRTETKFLPGDYLFMTYDIEGLKFDDKTGKANYLTILQLYDSNNKEIFKKETPNEVPAQLGGTRMPGDLHVIMGRSQAPGKYVVRLVVQDRLTKEVKYHDHRFELMPSNFGIVGVTAPALGFPGQHYVAGFALVDMGLDAKKMPNVDIVMKVLDENGTTPVARPLVSTLPADLPNTFDASKENFLEMRFPIYLNRPGRFIIEVDALDKLTQKTSKLRYPLTVIDINNLTGK